MTFEQSLLIAIAVLLIILVILSLYDRAKAWWRRQRWVHPRRMMSRMTLNIQIAPAVFWKLPMRIGIGVIRFGAWIAGIGQVNVNPDKPPAENVQGD